MRQKLNLITLGVDNLDRSLNFYEKGLGWKKSEKSVDDLALFPLGGITLALYPKEELAADVTLEYQSSAFSGLTFSYNAKSENEVDEVLKKVEGLGAVIIKTAQKVFWAVIAVISKIPTDIYLKWHSILFGNLTKMIT